MLICSHVLIWHTRKLRHKRAKRLPHITQSRAKPGPKLKFLTPMQESALSVNPGCLPYISVQVVRVGMWGVDTPLL